MKRSVGIVLTIAMVMSMVTTAFASDFFKTQSIDKDLKTAYEQIMIYAADNGIDLGMTYEDFINNYNGQPVQEYVDSYYAVLLPNSETYRSGGTSTYYYNTGCSCPASASYGKYNLLSVVKKGDIVFEANGGAGLTGHIAIVEGIYYRNDGSGGKYIRLVEAIANWYGGVTRSILDDTRVDEKGVSIWRVSGATSAKINGAVNFCVGELGSSYCLDLAKDTDASETDWYCSELVWAAYWNQGIDIEVGGLHGDPGVSPLDIVYSDMTYGVKYSKV